jgi:integrase
LLTLLTTFDSLSGVKPFWWEAKQSWAVDVPVAKSPTGKRQRKLFATRDAARDFCGDQKEEHNEHGRSGVTAEERHYIGLARSELGDLSILPEVLRHWRRTGTGAITATPVENAVETFKAVQMKRVGDRTKSDIRYRLDAFATHFHGRQMHQIHAGELETFIEGYDAAWSRRSFYKRLRPLFAHALRHRWIAENPMLLLKAPETPRASKLVYTGEQFQTLLSVADVSDPDYLLPFLVLSGFGFIRTSEVVRLYASENVLMWEDIDWKKKRIHIRENVGKSTRRKSGNERFVPMDRYLRNWLSIYAGKHSGPIVPDMHKEFAENMRKLHKVAEVPAIHNGLRRSAISHYLAAHPETGIGQLARLAGTSEATVKAHYLEALTPEAGAEWFKLGRKETPD